MERVGLVILLALGLGLCRGQDPEVLNMIQVGDAAFNKGKGSYPDAAAQYRKALVALSTGDSRTVARPPVRASRS